MFPKLRITILFGVLLCSTPCFLTAQSDHTSRAQVDALERELQTSREQLDTLEKQETHLEQSVVIMLTAVGIAAAVIIGTLIFGEYRINQAVNELKSRADEAKLRFPMLAGMESQARRALKELEMMFGAAEWQEDRYGNLDIERRQRILTVEHLIALEFTGPATAPQLRGMANFYASKFTFENLPSDLDRALYYGLLAVTRGKDGFQYLNDLGLIYIDLAARDHMYLALAKESFQHSKQKTPSQQRCYYNLGTMYINEAVALLKEGEVGKGRDLLIKACAELRTALGHKNWEKTVSPELTSVIHYNLACSLCRLAQGAAPSEGQSTELDEVVAELELASAYKQTKPTTFDRDLKNGDLQGLHRNRFYAQKVDGLTARFKKMWE
jgi:hypothetical protein